MGEGNELPSSLRRKTEGSKYSREKFLAREFLKWRTEQRLRESIRKTIKRLIWKKERTLGKNLKTLHKGYQ